MTPEDHLEIAARYMELRIALVAMYRATQEFNEAVEGTAIAGLPLYFISKTGREIRIMAESHERKAKKMLST